VDGGEGEKGERGRGDEAADDHAGERLLDLGADAVTEGIVFFSKSEPSMSRP